MTYSGGQPVAFPYPPEPWVDGQTAYKDNEDGSRTVATYEELNNTWHVATVRNDLGEYYLVPYDINMGDGTRLDAKLTEIETLIDDIELGSGITQSTLDAAIAPLTSGITAANDSIDAKFDAFRSAVEGATDFTSLRTRLLAVLPE
jgi:hypothetical protein